MDDLFAKVFPSATRIYKYEITIHNSEGRLVGKLGQIGEARYHAYADNKVVAWFKARKMLADIRAIRAGEKEGRKDTSFIVK